MLIHALSASNATTERADAVFKNGLLSFCLVSALLILSAVILGRVIKKLLKRYGAKKQSNFGFIASFINAVIYCLAGFGVLEQIVPLQNIAVSLLASSGVVALVVGLAAQESVANLISGILIVIYHPISVGDLVRLNGVTGTVEEITLRHTVICTSENSRLVVPNSVVNSSTLENITMKDLHCCNYLDVGVGYHADTDEAIRIMEEEILRHPLFLDVRTEEEKRNGAPAVVFRCLELGEFSVKLRAVIWSVDTASGSEMLSDLRLQIKKRFQSAGIELPYPYRNVVLQGKSVPAALVEEKSN